MSIDRSHLDDVPYVVEDFAGTAELAARIDRQTMSGKIRKIELREQLAGKEPADA